MALDEVRRLARGLRPSVLDDLGLAAALERYGADYSQAHGVALDLDVAGLAAGRLPGPVETALYRIVQEALTNTAKHAQARRIRIRLERDSDGVKALVADDGCGFDSDALSRRPGGGQLGLSGMRERAALLNGSVTIQSTPGSGTAVLVRIPLVEGNHDENSHPHRR
jgi:signal transduction histidine kinase